jgi:hypothetical protein
MVDENGKQTITNDGATVMKVFGQDQLFLLAPNLTSFTSFSTLSIPLLAS